MTEVVNKSKYIDTVTKDITADIVSGIIKWESAEAVEEEFSPLNVELIPSGDNANVLLDKYGETTIGEKTPPAVRNSSTIVK